MVIMSEVEDRWDYGSETRDPYQDRPTQSTLSDSSSIRQTRAKCYTDSAKKGQIKGDS